MRPPDQPRSRPDLEASLAEVQGENNHGLAKTVRGQARIAAAAERLHRTATGLGQQFRADVPQGEKAEMGQPVPDGPPSQFEPPVEFIPLEPTSPKGQDPDINVSTVPVTTTGRIARAFEQPGSTIPSFLCSAGG